MTRSPWKKNFFAGGNTAYGFYSLFDNILQGREKRLIVLKGGPGTGKSTIIRNLGTLLQDNGYNVEYFYCSSDSNSLDGFAAPDLKFAIIDGTPPHAMDLELPGINDEIINLGEFWEKEKLLPYRDELESINIAIKKSFRAAYCHLAESNLVLKHLKLHTSNNINSTKINKMVLLLLERIVDDEPCRKTSRERHLFGSAITPEGLVNHYDSIFTDCIEFYFLTGGLGVGISELLENIYQLLRFKGLDLEVYHCALDPKKIDALVIKEKRLAITKMSNYLPFKLSSSDIVYQENLSFDHFYPNMNSWEKELLEDYENTFNKLLIKGIRCLKRAKELQMKREPYYSKAMDFSRVKKIEERLIRELLG